jgi:hypothetical protein
MGGRLDMDVFFTKSHAATVAEAHGLPADDFRLALIAEHDDIP